MRRQKRDMTERAFTRGYNAGATGRTKDACPHNHSENRQQWLNGWREGRVDQWDGLIGISGIHKINLH